MRKHVTIDLQGVDQLPAAELRKLARESTHHDVVLTNVSPSLQAQLDLTRLSTFVHIVHGDVAPSIIPPVHTVRDYVKACDRVAWEETKSVLLVPATFLFILWGIILAGCLFS